MSSGTMMGRGWRQYVQVVGKTEPEVGEDSVNDTWRETAIDEILGGDAPTEEIQHE